MSSAPFSIVAGPARLWVNAAETAEPAVDASDTTLAGASWVDLGLTSGGVKGKHTQTVDLIKADQRTGPVKAIRSEEGLEITTTLLQSTLESFNQALNRQGVTAVGSTQVITLSGFGATDSFKLTYNGVEGATTFVRQTNAAASDLQTALRTATGDTGLLVTGTTDAGPYTVVFTAGFDALGLISVTSGNGCTGTVAETNPDQKSLKIYKGLDASELALLVRGPSPYMDDAFLQYWVPVCVNTEEPEAEFVRDGAAMLAVKFVAIEDPNASTADDRFGHLIAQTS